MPRLGIHRDFLKDYAALEKPVRTRVDEVFGKFDHATHAGLHLEKVNNARDGRFRTVRIDEFWRGVVLAPDSGDLYTLLKVLPHNDAYAWAQNRKVSVNAATGRIEIRDVAAIDATLPELSQHAKRTSTRLFAGVNDADLRRLGIDEQTLTFARALTHVMQLDAAQAFLPATQWEVLYALAAGYTPDQVWAEMSAAIVGAEFDPDDVSAAVARTDDRVAHGRGARRADGGVPQPVRDCGGCTCTPPSAPWCTRSTAVRPASPAARAPARPWWRCTARSTSPNTAPGRCCSPRSPTPWPRPCAPACSC